VCSPEFEAFIQENDFHSSEGIEINIELLLNNMVIRSKLLRRRALAWSISSLKFRNSFAAKMSEAAKTSSKTFSQIFFYSQ